MAKRKRTKDLAPYFYELDTYTLLYCLRNTLNIKIHKLFYNTRHEKLNMKYLHRKSKKNRQTQWPKEKGQKDKQ
jgi:hypothetical protein